MKVNELPPTRHIEDRRITRANAGKFVRNMLKAQEGYSPLPGNRLSQGDPRVLHWMPDRTPDRIVRYTGELNRMDTLPNSTPLPSDPNMRPMR